MGQRIRRVVTFVDEDFEDRENRAIRAIRAILALFANRTVPNQRIFPTGSKPDGCKFEAALLNSLSPAGSDADLARSQFWIKYEEIASDFDQRFVTRLENGVDISMLFAGLFSAVNTAFIIAIQSDIVVLNSSNAMVADIVNAGGLVSSPALTTALSYASLSTSLLSAFGALLAKQWLAHFKATRSTHGSLPSRGVHRQRKFDVMQNSHFTTILDCIPVLLEVSLLLFAISLLGNTWYPYRDVAGVVLAATAIGVTLYFVTFSAAMLSPDSPFQTLPSQLTQLLLKILFQLPQLWLKSLSELPQLVLDSGAQIARLPHYLRTSNSNPKFISLSITTLSWEAPAVRWLLQISTDPTVVTAVAKMVPEVDWPADFNLDAFVKPLLETFKSCFKVQSNDYNAFSLSCTDPDRAYACSKALFHLYSEILYGKHGSDPDLLRDLTSVKLCLSSVKNKYPQEHRFAFICELISLIEGDPQSTTSIGVPEEELSWVSHIIPAFLYSTGHGRQAWIDLAALIIPKFALYEPMPSKVLANYWVIIGLVIDMPINPDDLVKVDKSSAIEDIREDVCAFFEPGSPLRKTFKKTPNSDFGRALDFIFRVLSVERDRGMITGGHLSSWIVALYRKLTSGEHSKVWETNASAIINVLFRTAYSHSLINGWRLRTSSKYIEQALQRCVESGDAEMAGLVLPLWLDTSPRRIDGPCFDAITLLLGCNNPRWCRVAFQSIKRALNYHSSWQDLLRTDENRSTHFFGVLLQPLRIIYTLPTSGLAEWDHTLRRNAEDRHDMAFGYLRVVSAMADIDFFHGHLLARDHVNWCIDNQLDNRLSEASSAKETETETLQGEYPFLVLSVIASVVACSNPSCIEAAAHASVTIVEDYRLEWQTILSALQYIRDASRHQLDVNRITHIADYIKLARQPRQEVPMKLRQAIEARIDQSDSHSSAFDSALSQLLHVLDVGITPPTPPDSE